MLEFLTGWVIGASIRTIPLAVLFLTVRTLLKERLRLRAIQTIYLLIFIGFLLPIPIHSDCSYLNVFGEGFLSDVLAEQEFLYNLQELSANRSLDLVIGESRTAAADVALERKLAFVRDTAVLWSLGACFTGVVFIFLGWLFRKEIGQSLEECRDPRVLEAFHEVRAAYGVRREVQVLVSDRIPSPALMNVSEPRIVLPRGLLAALTSEDFKWIFRHELGHLENRDLMLNLFLTLYLCVFWFDPLAWVLAGACREDWELRCDRKVLRSVEASRRSEYGECLLKCLRFSKAQHRSSSTACLAATGRGMHTLKRRIRFLVQPEADSEILMDNMFILVYCLMFLFSPTEERTVINHRYESMTTTPVYASFSELNISEGVHIRMSASRSYRVHEPGKVLYIGKSQSLGNYMVLVNQNQQIALISHCGRIRMHVGDSVPPGSIVADAGS